MHSANHWGLAVIRAIESDRSNMFRFVLHRPRVEQHRDD